VSFGAGIPVGDMQGCPIGARSTKKERQTTGSVLSSTGLQPDAIAAIRVATLGRCGRIVGEKSGLDRSDRAFDPELALRGAHGLAAGGVEAATFEGAAAVAEAVAHRAVDRAAEVREREACGAGAAIAR